MGHCLISEVWETFVSIRETAWPQQHSKTHVAVSTACFGTLNSWLLKIQVTHCCSNVRTILSLDLQPYRWIIVWDYGFLRLNLTQIIMTRWDSISYKCLWQKLASMCVGYRCNRCVDLVSLRKTESDPSGSITEEQFLIFQRKRELRT